MARLSKLSRSIAGKTALVTGAASGMGRATAYLFADEGANVAVTDVNAEGAEKVAAEIRAAGGKAEAWALNVASKEDIERVTNAAGQKFGGLDILINYPGFSAPIKVEDRGFEENWARHMGVLLPGHARVVRAALPYLEKSPGGRIVNISFTEGLGAAPGIAPSST